MKKISFLKKIKYFGLCKVYFIARNLVFHSFLFLQDLFSPLLTSRVLSKKILEYFQADDGHNLSINKTFLGFGLIHYSLIRNTKPKRVLCIGSRFGFIPSICAFACKDNGEGIVDFVDAGFDKDHPKSWTGVGFWKKIHPEKHFSFSGLNFWINNYIMLSQEFMKKYPKRKYEYIYIDADHSYEGVKKDYQLFWPKLTKGGFMVFHDVAMKGRDSDTGQVYGVWKFWQELKNSNKITFPFPKDSGLGVLQKNSFLN